jgi:hypothetical protein
MRNRGAGRYRQKDRQSGLTRSRSIRCDRARIPKSRGCALELGRFDAACLKLGHQRIFQPLEAFGAA